MSNNLEKVTSEISACWAGLNSETTTAVRDLLIALTKTSENEAWLDEIIKEQPAAKLLYSDPKYGFLLLAHSEKKDTYRVPHDHGMGWVFYAVQSGQMEMATYKQITASNGKTDLVSRGKEIMNAGHCKVFLPGDIHDTLCLSDNFIQYRLTSSDFKEEIASGRMTRFLNKR
ncbi:hypothetical protein [Thalassotalea sediminis]|uniref:hypothetical protein n=1 Tax=Thalassotalea sediminis TaxID=1759089 RepID=UPI0025746086|nr:hypothetical protein [Thalassotalea sediminis]